MNLGRRDEKNVILDSRYNFILNIALTIDGFRADIG